MKTVKYIFFLNLLFLPLLTSAKTPDSLPKTTSKGFTENKGQFVDMNGITTPNTLFKMESNGVTVFVTTTGITYLYTQTREIELENKPSKYSMELTEKPTAKDISWERIDLELSGATITSKNIQKEFPLPGELNYFLGHCPEGIMGVKEYGRITFKEIYPGIDWVLYNTTNKGFKYDFIVHPGANPEDIKLIYSAKEEANITGNGAIEIKTRIGTLTENAPVSFLKEKQVESQFIKTVSKKNKKQGIDTHFKFQFDDKTLRKLQRHQLIIDPQLVWATYYGSNLREYIFDIKSDANNNIYFCGETISPNFPTQNQNGSYYTGSIIPGDSSCLPICYATAIDAVIGKFNPNGVRLWVTYYGGNDYDSFTDIEMYQNDVYVFGESKSQDIPLQQESGAYFQTHSGNYDLVLLKFNASSQRLWGTCIGGSLNDFSKSIKINSKGDIYITGSTLSTNYPVIDNGTYFQPTISSSIGVDAFITKFENQQMIWSTYYGGNTGEIGMSIAFDSFHNVLIGGTASPSVQGPNNFPCFDAGGGSYFQSTFEGSSNGFILKFNEHGSRLWATLYGGDDNDAIKCININSKDELYATGHTYSQTFPLLDNGHYFDNILAFSDHFILKFDNQQKRIFATLLGGGSYDHNYINTFKKNENIEFDACDNVFISIASSSPDLPTIPFNSSSYFQASPPPFVGSGGTVSTNIYFAKFNPHGTLLAATYFGGLGRLKKCLMDMDPSGNLLFGSSSNIWLNGNQTHPVMATDPNAYQSGISGLNNPTTEIILNEDLYFAKFLIQDPNTPQGHQITTTVCDSVEVGNIWYNTSTELKDTLKYSNGLCDSLIKTIKIIVYPAAVKDSLDIVFCSNSGVFDGQTYTQNTLIRDTIKNSFGCDSIYTIRNIKLFEPALQIDTLTTGLSCDSAYVNNRWHYTAGWVSDTSFISSPCDTLIKRYNVEIKECSKDIGVPNVFSPNGDGNNDLFSLHFDKELVEKGEYTIFDRWGTLIFKATDLTSNWDGTYENKKLNSATFVYTLTVTFIDGTTITKTGNITLLR